MYNLVPRFVKKSILKPAYLIRSNRYFHTSSIHLQQQVIHSSQVPTTNERSSTPLSETIRDFLSPKDFYNLLNTHGIDYFTGVPDSLLKDFCAYVTDQSSKTNHIITSNEGSAIATAAGYHLATNKFPCVYFQNSGFGNCINPLLSLTDSKIYSIPMLLLIGWRGEPGKKDEPQHLVQGQVMSSLLTDMNIQFEVLPDYIEGAQESLETAIHYMTHRKAPYAFLVKRQTFEPYNLQTIPEKPFTMNREDALQVVLDHSKEWDIFVSTTGFTSREVYEYRASRSQGHKRDFLCVGNMGHASALAMGIAAQKPSRNVFCLDGDGALLMHMGAITSIGQSQLKNYKHIVINNGAHDSVGGQPTVGLNVNFNDIFKASGYKWVNSVDNEQDLIIKLKELRNIDGPACLEIKVNCGARTNLGRPKTTPIENKIEFMNFLQD